MKVSSVPDTAVRSVPALSADSVPIASDAMSDAAFTTGTVSGV